VDSRPDGEKNALPPTRGTTLIRRVGGPLFRRAGLYGLLEVSRRRTGTPQQVPIFVLTLDGSVYVLAVGGVTDWALNLRAAGRAKLTRKKRTEPVTATEVFGDERDRVIKEFMRGPRPMRNDFNRRPDSADHPVFRLEPAH